MTKSLRLEYFAQFREARGVSAETVQTNSRTAAELFDELVARYHFPVQRATTRVAVNDALVPWSTPLRDGDTVVFLTPFGGG